MYLCLYIYLFIEIKIEGRIKVDGRRGGRRKELLDDLKETEAPDHTLWITPFGRGCGAVVRQTA